MPDHEKQGYALEAAQEVKRAGIEEFGIEHLKAITVKENLASQKLLERLGFKCNGAVQLPSDEEELLLYKYTTQKREA